MMSAGGEPTARGLKAASCLCGAVRPRARAATGAGGLGHSFGASLTVTVNLSCALLGAPVTLKDWDGP